MRRVIVVGGGIGGLVLALALARNGTPVLVLERDEAPVSEDPEAAFAAARRGAPQVHQTHGFLARLQVLIRDRFPDVMADLHAAGGTTLPMTSALGEPQPGDEDLRVLIVRRTTLEWVLRKAVLGEPGVELRRGVGVSGLVATDGALPRVTGVRLDDGSTLDADVVVAAHGRRADVPGWLGAIGVDVPETVVESGLMYLTRWYHLPPEFDIGREPKLGGDLTFVKFIGVPGDAGTLSVTLAVPTADDELRVVLSDNDSFDLACRLLPGPNIFFEDGPRPPIGDVRPMWGLMNRLRRFIDADGRPTVLGFHAVGDAHTCTNPLYGRGCSLAAAQAVALADALAAHPDDLDARAAEYEAFNVREVEPWYEVSLQMDRLGADPAGLAGMAGDRELSDEAKGLGAVFVAAMTDPVIGRAMIRFWNLLSRPSDLMSDPELLTRIAAVVAEPDKYPTPERDGPSRGELLKALTSEAVA